MSCGKKRLVKNWDRPRNIRVITPSRYEQNEESVKVHWKKVVRDMELSYKDDQFWETNTDTVRELVGPVIFKRLAKIFGLPPEATDYEPQSDITSLVPSEKYYLSKSPEIHLALGDSCSDFSVEDDANEDEEAEEEQSESWSVSSEVANEELQKKMSRNKSLTATKSLSKALSRMSRKSFPRLLSKQQVGGEFGSKIKFAKSEMSFSEDENSSIDDLEVQHSLITKRIRAAPYRHVKNPHHEMLYCNKSETDMIKWNSKYKVKIFEISASDEFSKKAEIMTKQIAKDFYDWWFALGNVEFKSEIKRPEDIEDLFQVWFDEHASKGLVLNPKILPCVLQSIAKYVNVPKAACPSVLNRQIAFDIQGETTPAHIMAFGTYLPHKMKHIPPQNNTKNMWHCVKIPEDLRSMSCVWEDIAHLTSTKAFQKWLEQRPHLPMPDCFKATDAAGDKKQLFVVPSDYVVKAKASTSSTQELALPVSQFSMELKEVLSKLMNQ